MGKSSNTGGMGMHKHGTSGYSLKSPKLRHEIKRVAEADEKKAKPSKCVYSSVTEALDKETK